MLQLLTNASVILEDRILTDGFVEIDSSTGRILRYGQMKELSEIPQNALDCREQYISPGFIDSHSHGGGGCDFMDGDLDSFLTAAKLHLQHGTTSILPTTLTSSDSDLYLCIDNFKKAKEEQHSGNLPHLLGLHLEGPYFSEREKGAQNSIYIRSPSYDDYMRIYDYAEGNILRWSVAPELDGALEMGDILSKKGVLMSIGHTAADYETVRNAVQHGYSHVTHLYSGMSTITRKNGFRILGVVECAYLFDELTVEIIADGMHLPPELLRLILKCKDNDKISLITDSMRGAGEKEGPSILGSLKDGQDVIIEDGIAKMPDRSCFAGSVCTTDRCVRTLYKQAGASLVNAVRMMTLNPARLLHIDSHKGSIEVGKDADLLVFNDNIDISNIFVGGKQVK